PVIYTLYLHDALPIFRSCTCGINLNQRFGQNPAVQFLWRCYSEYAQNRWGKIDIASWQIVHLTAAKIRTGCNQDIVHVESAEGGDRKSTRLNSSHRTI